MPIALANWLESQRRFWEASLERLESLFLEPQARPRRVRRKRKNEPAK
jgi:hypothetical protein